MLSASSLNRKRSSFPNSCSKIPRSNSDWPGLSHMPISEQIPADTNVGLSLSKLTWTESSAEVPWATPPSDTKTLALRGLWREVMVARIMEGRWSWNSTGLAGHSLCDLE